VDWKHPVGEITSENSGVFCFLWEAFYPSSRNFALDIPNQLLLQDVVGTILLLWLQALSSNRSGNKVSELQTAGIDLFAGQHNRKGQCYS
jgi:hypothetical protein